MTATPRVWPPRLNWSASSHWDYAPDPSPCVLCGKPTHLLSDSGAHTHKVCAEIWFEAHPDAWAEYELRRDARKKANRKGVEIDNSTEFLEFEAPKPASRVIKGAIGTAGSTRLQKQRSGRGSYTPAAL